MTHTSTTTAAPNPHLHAQFASGQPNLHPQVQPSGMLDFQEGIGLPANQTTTTMNGFPMVVPEDVGNYPGLGTSPPQLLIRNRLGAPILREILLDGQNPEVYTRQ